MPIDLLSKNFSQNFKKIDWNWQLPSIYIFEGMSYYLPLKVLSKIIDTFSETMAEGSVLIMDYFPDYVKERLDPLMATIIDAGGETCLTYLGNKEIKKLFNNFSIISDRLENDLEKEYYSDSISEPIASIIVARKG